MITPTSHLDAAPISSRLDAVILLAGGLRPSPLVQGTGISVLDLPLRQNQTVLEHWIEKLGSLVQSGDDSLERAIIAYTANSPRPSLPLSPGRLPPFRFVCDQTGLRGPAGTLRDLCQHLEPEANIFIGEASRFIGGDLRQFLEAHLELNADITVGCNPDGTPAGVYLARRKSLDLVPSEGFIDIKEQWLRQAVKAGCRIPVVTCSGAACQPLRTWTHYLQAIRTSTYPEADPKPPVRFMNSTAAALPSIVIQSPDATVGKGAQIIDSVIMAGSVIDDGALIVRSYIGPGVYIRSTEKVVDRMIRTNNNSATGTKSRSGLRAFLRKKKRDRK